VGSSSHILADGDSGPNMLARISAAIRAEAFQGDPAFPGCPPCGKEQALCAVRPSLTLSDDKC
jgi:hypothetical protein